MKTVEEITTYQTKYRVDSGAVVDSRYGAYLHAACWRIVQRNEERKRPGGFIANANNDKLTDFNPRLIGRLARWLEWADRLKHV